MSEELENAQVKAAETIEAKPAAAPEAVEAKPVAAEAKAAEAIEAKPAAAEAAEAKPAAVEAKPAAPEAKAAEAVEAKPEAVEAKAAEPAEAKPAAPEAVEAKPVAVEAKPVEPVETKPVAAEAKAAEAAEAKPAAVKEAKAKKAPEAKGDGAKKPPKPEGKKAGGDKKAGDKKAGGDKKSGEAKKSAAAEAPRKALPPDYVPRLKKIYKEKIAPELKAELNYSSAMQIPKLEKIVVSMGVGKATENKKLLDAAVEDLTLITGQKAVKTKAKKSVANFKVRAGQEIGARVTLRGAMMYEFLDRLVNVALPRVKDFRGINASAFDGHGNYALGINEQIIFPEIDFDKIERIAGLNVVIVTTAKTDKEALAFLTKFGLPFKK